MNHLLWIIPLTIIAMLLWTLVRRDYQMRDLVAQGVPVTGKVIRQLRFTGTRGQRNRYLRYEFSVGAGRYTHKIAVTVDESERYQDGDAIQLIYLPSNPKVSARVEMVEQCRQALQKKGV